MNKQFELLAPGGEIDAIKAAIAAGADAVYCGLDRFNARNRATNLSLDTLKSILPIAHHHQCKLFITLNISLLDSEIPAMMRLLEQLNALTIDGVIIQDLGLAYLLQHHFPELDVHASTQLNTHNEGQIQFMAKFGVSRVNLARELNLEEIRHLAHFGHQHNVLMEVFVHGSYCIGFSGLCYMSSARNGASGNRGRCSQPCRDTYQTTDMGIHHPLNMKDNSAYQDLDKLADAGVYSLKIEGRIKKPHYVYTVVDQWRKQIDHYQHQGEILNDTTTLYKVFNRDFSAGYLHNTIGKQMYIDNPRNHSAQHFLALHPEHNEQQRQKMKQWVYDENTQIIEQVNAAIHDLSSLADTLPEPTKLRRKQIPFTAERPAPHQFKQPEQLSLMISSAEQAAEFEHHNGTVFYHLPNALAKQQSDIEALLQRYPHLVPWFPSILIGADYTAATQILDLVKPQLIATDNNGVAHYAHQIGLEWIAGPQFNLMNSHALRALKTSFGCVGAFVSEELSRPQLKRITPPEQFRLFYNLYHPMDLMVSRQCFFQQTVGCRKPMINRGCVPRCEKSTSLINLNGSAYVIDKKKGELNHIYHNQHFLNGHILTELPLHFSDVMVDLRNIPSESHCDLHGQQLIDLFQQAIEHRDPEPLYHTIQNTTRHPYLKGL